MSENKQLYIRFHTRVDDALTKGAEATGMKRATLVTFILENFLRQLDEKCESGALVLQPGMAPEQLGISPLASLYALKLGRSVGNAPRAIGKPMILTLTPAADRQIRLLAQLCEMTLNHFRSAVVTTFLIEQKMLGEA